MLITEMKNPEAIRQSLRGRVFAIVCHGCREVCFPTGEVAAFLKELDCLAGSLTTDYICSPENLALRLQAHADAIESADTILVFSCGVGVQTVADRCPHKRVCAGCDTVALPGYQGVTPLEVDCRRCGECFLNLTGGICPLTACSKGLVNGQCGGAKNGKCEVDPDMDCGWELILRRLAQTGRLDALKCPVQIRDYTAGNRKE